MQQTKPHEGRNVKRIREILGIKQDALARDLGLSQQTLSGLEQKEALDAELLEKIAAALKVPVEAIKDFNEEAAVNIISNTFENSNNSGSINNVNSNCELTFNPLDKLMEVMEENKRLYERLLKAEQEKTDLLQKLLERFVEAKQ